VKRRIYRTCIEILLLSLASAACVADESLRYNLGTSGSSVPYENAVDDLRPGIMVELLPLIMDTAGFKTEKVMLSTKRAAQAFKNGVLDFDFFSPEWVPSNEANSNFVFTDAIIGVTEYFITLPENVDRYRTRNQIHNDSIVGTVEGYVYFDADTFTPLAFQSESDLILALHNQRIEVAIMEEAVARYWSAKHGVKISFGAIHTKGSLALRLHSRHKDKIGTLNQVIKKLRAEGKIQSVIDKYADFSI
jgi:polar amino acid transport system substrate-binding protein